MEKLITEELHEFDLSSVQKAYGSLSGPLNVMWDITNKCNLNCKHCYNKSGKGKLYEDLTDEEMFQILEGIIKLSPTFLLLLI